MPDDAAGAIRNSRACPSLLTRQLPRNREARACSQRDFPNSCLLRILRLRVVEDGKSLNCTSLRAHFAHSENSGIRAAHLRQHNPLTDCFGSKRLRRIFLQSREQAVHETLSPCHRCVLAFVFVSHSLLFTLSEDLHQNAADVRLR